MSNMQVGTRGLSSGDWIRLKRIRGMAFGSAITIIERFSKTVHMVTPQKWKKDMGLTSDKAQSMAMARELWPLAPLHRQKDNGRAEALLLAEWYRRQQ